MNIRELGIGRNQQPVSFLKNPNNYNNLIKNVKEQIEMAAQNDSYSDDIKKLKIEQLQKHLEEIENLKRIREAEVLKSRKKIETHRGQKKYTDISEDGDTYLSSQDARMIISVQVSKEKIALNNLTRANLSAEANRLMHDIQKDKELPGNTGIEKGDFKNWFLDKLRAGIKRLTLGNNGETERNNQDLQRLEEEIKDLNARDRKSDETTNEAEVKL